MSILVVDDQKINRIALSRLLETFNFPVLQATNGLEGLQLYIQHRVNICLVFLDLMMPVLDGWSTAAKMRDAEEEHNWLNVPIVAYTSEDVSLGSPLWTRCIESGMNDVVGKPINRQYTTQLLYRYIPYLAAPPPLPPNTASSSRNCSIDLDSSQQRAQALPAAALRGEEAPAGTGGSGGLLAQPQGRPNMGQAEADMAPREESVGLGLACKYRLVGPTLADALGREDMGAPLGAPLPRWRIRWDEGASGAGPAHDARLAEPKAHGLLY